MPSILFLDAKICTFILISAILVLAWRQHYFICLGPFAREIRWPGRAKWVPASFALTFGLFYFDLSILTFLQGHHDGWFEKIISYGGAIARDVKPWLFMAACYFIFLALKQPAGRHVALGALVSSALASLAAVILKFVVLRARPNAGAGPFSFFNIDGLVADDGLYQSFPSGDVVVIAGAAFFLWRVTRHRIVRWVFPILPLLTACSRICLNRHWPSDTFFSLVLGLAAATLVFRYHVFMQAKARPA